MTAIDTRDTSGRPPSFLFDLDGTLIDSVYQHVIAWWQALTDCGIDLALWEIHRRVGMSGGLMIRAVMREFDRPLDPEVIARISELHAEHFATVADQVRPLPGASELLHTLTGLNVPWAIATSGHMKSARHGLAILNVLDGNAPIITRDLVRHAKPDPDLFIAAAVKLGVPIESSWVIGDSIWDMMASRRARALGIGLRSGGYSGAELREAGAFRVFDDPADMLSHLDELGVRENE